MFYLDIDELDQLGSKCRLLARNRFAPYAFHDSDHYHRDGLSIRGSIETLLRENGQNEPIGKIQLLTHLRTWGHIFNPVSFYFISDRDGRPLSTIAEVGNTFNEQKMFLLPTNPNGSTRQDRDKEFYVSPFSDLDTAFHFNLRRPLANLRLTINQSSKGKCYFRSALSGTQRPLTDSTLLFYILRFPLITMSIVTAIHWQALKLYLKGIRARPKAENPHLQTNVRPSIKKQSYPIH